MLYFPVLLLFTDYFFRWRLQNIAPCFLNYVDIKAVFILKMFCSLFASRILAADFERIFIVSALARLTKVQNIWFRPVIEFIFRYAIEAKFTAWRVSFTSKFTWKTDIALIASWLMRYRFFTLISRCNSPFRQWIFLHCTSYWKMKERRYTV